MSYKKVQFFYDVETTGLPGGVREEFTPGVVSIGIVVVVDGINAEEYHSTVNCGEYDRNVSISETALKINGMKQEDIHAFNFPQNVVSDIISLAQKYVMFNGKRRVLPTLVGFNNNTFDQVFLEDLFLVEKEEVGKYFKYKQLDLFEMLKCAQAMKLIMWTFNQKLVTYLEKYKIYSLEEIEANAHNALWDARATFELYKHVQKHLENDRS